MKAIEQYIAEWQYIIFTMPDKLWPLFASNWSRGELLPKIYAALEIKVKTRPAKPDYAVMMKKFTDIDPYLSVLCGVRMVFSEFGSRFASRSVASPTPSAARKEARLLAA